MKTLRSHWFGLVFGMALALLGTASGARAQIFQPGSQPIGEEGGISETLESSGKCTECHGEYGDGTFEPWDTWRGSMMGNAGRDLVFRAALAIAEKDNPDAPDFCVRCHSLPAWLRGRSSLPEWATDTKARFTPDSRAFLSNDLDGVSCVVCHQVQNDVPSDADAPHLSNAQIYLLDGDDSKVRLGPYTYEDNSVELMHAVRQGPFLATGELCGQCHDITNPVVMGRRADGTATGRNFVIERTYSEWKHSAFPGKDQTCQHCHMPKADEPLKASGADDSPARDYYRKHELVGGNAWMPRALVDELPDQTDTAKAALMRTADLAEAMLRTAAEVEMTDASVEDGVVHVKVRVTNKTGHKLPTGYPEGRRMWLAVTVKDAAGQVLASSGAYDDATATLQEDEQLRTYEIKLGEDDTPSFHFIKNNTVLEDTRIPPEGFAPEAELDMAPVGRDYGDGKGGYHPYDDVTYDLPVCGDGGDVTVTATLRFQTTTREYIEFLRDNAPDSLDPAEGNFGARAYAAWMKHGGDAPIDMAMAERTLTVQAKACGGKAKSGGCAVAAPGSDRRGHGLPMLVVAVLIAAWGRRRSYR